MDPIAQFKEGQKQAWSTFAPTELYTCQPAARLVAYAQIQAGQRVLDVGCGTGVVALAAARTGARVSGLDLTPGLLARARENASIAGVAIDWHEGDAEALPFEDASFDVVVSQFGHIFAPRPEVAVSQMLRVLRPGGTLAFSTWPPELYVGRMFALVARYMPPPPGVTPPSQWGHPDTVRARLGDAVTDLRFDRGTLKRLGGPIMRLVQTLAGEPARLAELRRELDQATALYFEPTENVLRQDYLMTRATKA